MTALAALTMMTGCAQHITVGRETPPAPTPGGYPDTVKMQIVSKWGYPCIVNSASGACEYKNARRPQFGIHNDGQLGYVKLVKPSGYPTYDEHAITTVKSAAPFPPIPDSFSLKGVNRCHDELRGEGWTSAHPVR